MFLCDRLGYDVRPVRAFLKICSKPKNLRMDRLTVVLPDNAELDDALGDGDDLESLLVFGVLGEEGGGLEGGDELYGMLDGVANGRKHRVKVVTR